MMQFMEQKVITHKLYVLTLFEFHIVTKSYR